MSAGPWGYYWVTTDEGTEPVIAEWRCADARRNEGQWWFCGAGAYDDSADVKTVLAGPLQPPACYPAPEGKATP